MNIDIVCVGKVKERYLRDAIDEYRKRLSRFAKVDVIEVADEKTPEHASDTLNAQIKEKEGERILKHLRDGAFVVALAIEGDQLTSEQLAARIAQWGLHGVSKMTFPHQLMRVILLEQIYRAFKINAHEPYHK